MKTLLTHTGHEEKVFFEGDALLVQRFDASNNLISTTFRTHSAHWVPASDGPQPDWPTVGYSKSVGNANDPTNYLDFTVPLPGKLLISSTPSPQFWVLVDLKEFLAEWSAHCNPSKFNLSAVPESEALSSFSEREIDERLDALKEAIDLYPQKSEDQKAWCAKLDVSSFETAKKERDELQTLSNEGCDFMDADEIDSDYAENYANDNLNLRSEWPYNHIDWAAAADDLREDLETFSYGRQTLVRN